jgi:hypothetical protein
MDVFFNRLAANLRCEAILFGIGVCRPKPKSSKRMNIHNPARGTIIGMLVNRCSQTNTRETGAQPIAGPSIHD